jgi:hypothetical protein
MFGLTTLRTAILTLAGNLQALAQTAQEVNHGVRLRLMLDAPQEVPALGHTHAEDGVDATEPVSPSKRNGRTKAGA